MRWLVMITLFFSLIQTSFADSLQEQFARAQAALARAPRPLFTVNGPQTPIQSAILELARLSGELAQRLIHTTANPHEDLRLEICGTAASLLVKVYQAELTEGAQYFRNELDLYRAVFEEVQGALVCEPPPAPHTPVAVALEGTVAVTLPSYAPSWGTFYVNIESSYSRPIPAVVYLKEDGGDYRAFAEQRFTMQPGFNQVASTLFQYADPRKVFRVEVRLEENNFSELAFAQWIPVR